MKNERRQKIYLHEPELTQTVAPLVEQEPV